MYTLYNSLSSLLTFIHYYFNYIIIRTQSSLSYLKPGIDDLHVHALMNFNVTYAGDICRLFINKIRALYWHMPSHGVSKPGQYIAGASGCGPRLCPIQGLR